ncbi:MAG: alpha/beta hydrolase [Woeseiaceae bacterium]|nr:alpha/beta hydrolase [Woeseiaceae bacterium]
MKLKRTLIVITVILVISVISISAAFLVDMRREHERVTARGIVIPSPYGDIEFTERGTGQPVLVIHGSGGGYDQGELIAEAVLGDEFRWITPSRFGYLRSSYHEGASWDDQANAYAYLLDHLGIGEIAVVAMSHGGPSALLFAVLHPARISSLTLVSCGVASSSSPDQASADRKGRILTSVFKWDFPYWAISKLAKQQFMELMGASEIVIESLSGDQHNAVGRIIDYMNPVSLRSAGVSFDNTAVLPGDRIAAILAPTLILHAKDDSLQLYHNAEFAARMIPHAEFIPFERGGHILMIVEQSAIRTAVRKHITTNASDSSRKARLKLLEK